MIWNISSSEEVKLMIESMQKKIEQNADAISELHNFNYYTLNPTNNNLTIGGEKTFILFNARKFSDYHAYMFVLVFGGMIRDAKVIPRGLFCDTAHFKIVLANVDSGNTQRWAEVEWVSDSFYSVETSPNMGSDPLLFVYGLV